MDTRSRELKEPLLDDTERADMELGQAETKGESRIASYQKIDAFLRQASRKQKREALVIILAIQAYCAGLSEFLVNITPDHPSRSSVYPLIFGLSNGVALLAFLCWYFFPKACSCLEGNTMLKHFIPKGDARDELKELINAGNVFNIDIKHVTRIDELRKELDKPSVLRTLCREVVVQGLFKDQGSSLDKLSHNELFDKNLVPIIFEFAGLAAEPSAEKKLSR